MQIHREKECMTGGGGNQSPQILRFWSFGVLKGSRDPKPGTRNAKNQRKDLEKLARKRCVSLLIAVAHVFSHIL